MAAELAVIDILRDDATLGALVGGTGTDAKVYPYEIPQKVSFPCVVVSVEDVEPNDDKDGTSPLDVEYIAVEFMDTKLKNTASSSGTYHMAVAGRSALDRTSGSYNGITVQSIQFQSSDSYVTEINNKVIYIQEDIYKVRVVR